VRKARGLEHQEGWIGFEIAPSGRMEFVSLPAEKQMAQCSISFRFVMKQNKPILAPVTTCGSWPIDAPTDL
jgi:hypothetical protein